MTVDHSILERLVDAFLVENSTHNLSAFRTKELCRRGNIEDSLAFVAAMEEYPDLSHVKRVLDMGTGGGFPLLPLALLLPEASFTGVDSVQKKVAAVERIAHELQITNIRVSSRRLEELGRMDGERESYDLVTARALATLPILIEYAAPLLKIGGWCAFWKSDKVADELASSLHAQSALAIRYCGTVSYDLGEGFGKRAIVLFQKKGSTSTAYPREVGMAKKHPL